MSLVKSKLWTRSLADRVAPNLWTTRSAALFLDLCFVKRIQWINDKCHQRITRSNLQIPSLAPGAVVSVPLDPGKAILPHTAQKSLCVAAWTVKLNSDPISLDWWSRNYRQTSSSWWGWFKNSIPSEVVRRCFFRWSRTCTKWSFSGSARVSESSMHSASRRNVTQRNFQRQIVVLGSHAVKTQV